MSRARVHNFAISLDGFGTGEPQSRDAPFGHAGERLHEWMFATRFWKPDGSGGVDDVFAQQFEPGKAYPERDVNMKLGLYHGDYAALRRYLVDEEFLERRDGFYWRIGGSFDPDDHEGEVTPPSAD